MCGQKLGKRKDLEVLLGFSLTIVFIRTIRLANSPIKDPHEDNIKSQYISVKFRGTHTGCMQCWCRDAEEGKHKSGLSHHN